MNQEPSLPSYSPVSPAYSTGPAVSIATTLSDEDMSRQYTESTTSTYVSDLVQDVDSLSPLPFYCSGASVEQVTDQNALYSMPKVSVNNLKDTYDIGDIIDGTIKFCPVKEVKLHAVFVVLECKVATVHSKWQSSQHTGRRMIFTHYVVPTASLPQDKIAMPKMIYAFPFTLQVPAAQTQGISCETGVHEHLQLPPSVGSLTGISHLEDNLPSDVARINYQLRATVQVVEPGTADKIINFCHGTEFLHFTPSYFPSIASLQNLSRLENFSTSQKLKKQLWRKAPKGSVEIQILHVPVLSMAPTQIVTIPLQLIFFPEQTDSAITPPMVSQITTNLVSQTFYTYDKEIPAAKDKSEKQKVTRPFLLSKLAIGTTAWNLHSASKSIPAYSTVLEVPVSLPKTRLITPTFETCLVARDYKLQVTVHLQNKSRVAVEVPVVVVARLPPGLSPVPTVGVPM